MDAAQSILPRVTYGFDVNYNNGTSISKLKNQKALDGTSTQEVEFPNIGIYNI